MKNKINTLVGAFFIAFIIYILFTVPINTFYLGSLAFIFLVFVLWLASFFSEDKKFVKLNVFVKYIVLAYILLESITYTLFCFGVIRSDIGFLFNSFSGSDGPIVKYDSLCGYKPVPGVYRHISIINGQVEFDHNRVANEQGWYSKRNYTKRKGDKKRYIVLGDSYSGGMAISETWVDMVNDLSIQSGNDSIELYNFSLEGAGLVNWYRIFYYEIIPNYEFDGVIFASSSEKDGVPDLDRQFIVANSFSDISCMAVIDLREDSIPHNFESVDYIPMSPICSGAQLDEIKDRYERGAVFGTLHFYPPDLYFIKSINNVFSVGNKLLEMGKKMDKYQKKQERYEMLVDRPYQQSYFVNYYSNLELLYSMWEYGKKNNKELIWVTIPDYEHALEFINDKDVIYRKEAEFMAKEYEIAWFDGYQLFMGKDEAFVKKSYYEFDKHWNASTAKIFAEHFYLFLSNDKRLIR